MQSPRSCRPMRHIPRPPTWRARSSPALIMAWIWCGFTFSSSAAPRWASGTGLSWFVGHGSSHASLRPRFRRQQKVDLEESKRRERCALPVTTVFFSLGGTGAYCRQTESGSTSSAFSMDSTMVPKP
jgi:hypothetical protein